MMRSSRPSHNEKRQNELRQFLVDWLVHDSRPLKIVQSEYFRRLIRELDPAFIIPDVKLVKAIIHRAYNHSVPLLRQKLQEQATSLSLTCDLWTACNRTGYLGITGSYVDNNFIMNEVTLAVTYVRYPHTANHIREVLEYIINEWNLKGKILSITTDNGSNIKKAVNDMEGIDWLGCKAHTLQLVVGKGLMPVKILVARAKRLIDFFMKPKQSERLEDIQKSYKKKSTVVYII
jgi:hypothetical protein